MFFPFRFRRRKREEQENVEYRQAGASHHGGPAEGASSGAGGPPCNQATPGAGGGTSPGGAIFGGTCYTSAAIIGRNGGGGCGGGGGGTYIINGIQRADQGTNVEYEGIIAGEIIGIRAWSRPQHPPNFQLLSSITVYCPWPTDRPLEAHFPSTATSAWDSSSEFGGIHAFKDDDFGRAELFTLLRLARTPIVWGKVALWGDVIEHEHGYRAQFARIVSLEDNQLCNRPFMLSSGSIERLRDTYGL